MAESAPEPAARTPERQALAEAIRLRERVRGILAERRALVQKIEDDRSPLYSEQTRLEDLLKQMQAAGSSERERLHALLNGQEPPAESDAKQVERDLAAVNAEITASHERQRRAEADVHLLEGDLNHREGDVRDRADDVVAVHPALQAVVAELEIVTRRRTLLLRALGVESLSVSRIGRPHRDYQREFTQVMRPEGVCPWSAARARLHSDPDAVLPMPADVA